MDPLTFCPHFLHITEYMPSVPPKDKKLNRCDCKIKPYLFYIISETERVMMHKDGWEDEDLEGALIIGLPGEEEDPDEDLSSKE